MQETPERENEEQRPGRRACSKIRGGRPRAGEAAGQGARRRPHAATQPTERHFAHMHASAHAPAAERISRLMMRMLFGKETISSCG